MVGNAFTVVDRVSNNEKAQQIKKEWKMLILPIKKILLIQHVLQIIPK